MIKPVSHIADMPSYALADLSPPDGKPLISLAQNESATGPSPKAIEAGVRAIANAHLYPDPDWCELRAAIAETHKISGEDILCGTGSMELIACLARGYAGPGDHVLSTQYGYAYFRSATLAAGAVFDEAQEENLTVCVDALLAAVNPKTRIVFVANPGNPTGTRIPKSEIVRLRENLDPQILLVVDEAYGEFSEPSQEKTFDLVTTGNVVVLRTFSKAYALAGMHIGWGLFPPKIAREVRKILNPNNVSIAGQAMAVAAINDQPYMLQTCADTISRRDNFANALRGIGLDIPESHTNFVLVQFRNAAMAQTADQALRRDGIIMRGMAAYGLPHCLRATIGQEKDMDHAKAILEDCLKQEASS